MRLTALLTVLALLSISCVGETTGTTSSTNTTSPEPTVTSPDPETSSTQQERDVSAALGWFIEVLNGEPLTRVEYERRFSDAFRAQVSYAEFQKELTQLRPGAPYIVLEESLEGDSAELIIQPVDRQGSQLRLVAALEDDGRFGTLRVQPVDGNELESPVETIEEAFNRLAGLGELRALTAEVVGDECILAQSINENEPAPIASVFKLYVLAAIGEAIDEGELSWDDEFVIDDALKSVPTGVLHDRPAGSPVTVGEAAQLMISISDNTATDHLISLLGRETVEAVMVEYGNTTPELNTPLLTTRELTALKVGPASGLKTQWVDADFDERSDILDQISGITPADIPLRDWSDPVMPDRIGWFATAVDLCELGVRLGDLSDRVPEIAAILEDNPGIPGDNTWDRVWFMGGSEPGLLAMWFRTESDGRIFITAGSVVDAASAFDQTEAALLFGAAHDLLSP